MKKHENPNVYRGPITFLDPLGLSSKLNLGKKTVALLCLLGPSLVITSVFLHQPPSFGDNPMALIGAILYLIAWLGALANALKAGSRGWLLFLLFPAPFVLLIYSIAGPGPTPKPSNSSLLPQEPIKKRESEYIDIGHLAD